MMHFINSQNINNRLLELEMFQNIQMSNKNSLIYINIKLN